MSNSIVYHDFAVERRHSTIPLLSNANEDEVDLGKYASTLYQSRWLVGLIVLVGILCAALYMMAAKPMYEANFLIHVEEEGENKPNTTFNEMGAMFKVKTSATAEIELVKSRLVISRALENLNIYVSAEPRYFPVVGKWIAMKDWQLPVIPGLGSFAWNRSEVINVNNFSLPDALLNKEFILTARENRQFDLENSKENISASGRVGVPLRIVHPAGTIELLIGELQATPGVQFRLHRASRLAMIEATQSNLNVVEQGKQSAVISVILRGDDPERTQIVLAEIARQYIAQNAARKTQEAKNALAFLNNQLPGLKRQLEESETKYNQYRNSKGTIDLAEEAKSDLQQLALAKTRKADLEQKRTELLIRFTTNHPVVEGVETQLQNTNTEIRKLTGHIKSLPLMEQELLKLSRDVKINTDLYTSLLNTARQMRLVTVAAGTNVRLVDMPMTPERPVSLSNARILGLGIFGGLLAGIAAAFGTKALRSRIEEAAEIETALNMPVFAAIPFSSTQQKLQTRRGADAKRIPLLAREAPSDEAVESLRGLRAVLRFSVSQPKNNIMLLISPTIGNGKSFISANLAALMGVGNKRLLLIDSDLRNGDLHHYFGVSRTPGLAEALAGMVTAEAIIRPSVSPNVDFISSGALPADMDLLMQPRLEELLGSLAPRYDMVIVNGAPLLEVSDSLAIAAHAAAIYIVVRAGVSTSGEIAETVRILGQAGFSAKGCLLNGVKTQAKPSAYQYRYRTNMYWQTRYQLKNLPSTEVSEAVVKMRQG